jgi:DNA-directed RNA polymerase specialized sigma24 family protein
LGKAGHKVRAHAIGGPGRRVVSDDGDAPPVEARGGDGEWSIDEYVRLRGAHLVRLARLLARDRDLAKDLVQEVLGKAFTRWSRIVRGGDPDVFVRRMLVNANVSWWRRRSSSELVTGDLPAPVDDHR